MAKSAKAFAVGVGAALGLILLAAPGGWTGGTVLGADAQSPSMVTSDGVTLRSDAVTLPDDTRVFAGANADAVNANCLTCHSAGMVLTQPSLTRSEWQGEVEKMIKTYKAPVAEADVPAIVDYLADLDAGK
jgi:hypothetical protein